MIGRRRGEVDDAAPDLAEIWATDTIPVDDGPTEFDWSSTEREPEPPPGDADPPSRRGKVVGVGIAAALLLVLGAIVVWPRGGDAPDEAVDEPDTPPATLSTLPSTETTRPEATVDDDDEESVADGESGDSVVVDPDTVGDVELPTGDILDEVNEAAEADALPTSIELPAELAAISAPTEVVMTTADGLVTLSLPSGNLRFVDSPAPPGFQGGAIVVTPDSAAYSLQGMLAIVSREGSVFEVDTSAAGTDFFLNGWLIGEGGETEYRVSSFSGNGDQAELFVSVADGITPAPGTSNVTDMFLRSTVGNLANDTGGVYRTGDDGSVERISTGRAFTANGDRLLLRECDEARVCSVVVVDLETGERLLVDGGDDALGNAFSLDLAPDGTTFARQVSEGAGSAARQIVALDGTIIAETETFGFFTSGTSWTADGSGIIEAAPNGTGLRFLDRSSGETVAFGEEELGQVFSYGVRYPDAELPPSMPGPTTSPIALTEPFSVPTGLDLVVLGDTGRMAYVDLDDRSAVAWPAPRLGGTRPPEIFVQGTQLTVVGERQNAGFAAEFGSAASLGNAAGDVSFPPSPRVPGPSPELVWAERSTESSGVDHRLFVIDGSLPASDGLELVIENSTFLGGDATGGLLAEIGGDIFSVGIDGQNRITSGDLLALNGQQALVRECNGELDCSVSLISRESDALTPITEPALTSAVPVDSARTAPVVGSISPDGTALLVEVPTESGPTRWAIVDLRTQVTLEVPEPTERQPLVWNDLSTYLAYVSDGDIWVYDRTNGRLSRVEGLGSVRSIASVGSDFAVAEAPGEAPVEQLET